jgi:hypothetical protein
MRLSAGRVCTGSAAGDDHPSRRCARRWRASGWCAASDDHAAGQRAGGYRASGRNDGGWRAFYDARGAGAGYERIAGTASSAKPVRTILLAAWRHHQRHPAGRKTGITAAGDDCTVHPATREKLPIHHASHRAGVKRSAQRPQAQPTTQRRRVVAAHQCWEKGSAWGRGRLRRGCAHRRRDGGAGLSGGWAGCGGWGTGKRRISQQSKHTRRREHL